MMSMKNESSRDTDQDFYFILFSLCRLCGDRWMKSVGSRKENYWQKTFLDVDFPLNKFQNDVLKDRISIFFSFFSFRSFVICWHIQGLCFFGGRKREGWWAAKHIPWRWWTVNFYHELKILVDDPASSASLSLLLHLLSVPVHISSKS